MFNDYLDGMLNGLDDSSKGMFNNIYKEVISEGVQGRNPIDYFLSIASVFSKIHQSTKRNQHKESMRALNENVLRKRYGSISDSITPTYYAPVVLGVAKVSGAILWHGDIKRMPVDGGYKYTISLMVGICKGHVNDISKVWINGEIINNADYKLRLYHGTETQEPDDEVVKYMKEAAYANKGLAYAVFKDMPILDLDNRVPIFEFEVTRRPPKHSPVAQERCEEMIKSITMIPGCGEFVYDTKVQMKVRSTHEGAQVIREPINMHNHYDKANALLALDQLKETLPNVEWIAPVVCWFASSTDVSKCAITPGVEFKDGIETYPDKWHVGSYTRANATLIEQIEDKPIYGGTVNDASVIRFLKEMRARGYKIMFYPMVFVNLLQKPWRGRIGGNSTHINKFFNSTHGYKKFVMHYANLVKGLVDGFVIGSEMVELNSISSSSGVFPAVDEWVEIARLVRAVLGKTVKLTYAADWTEYSKSKCGYHHLDKLWSSENIDFVGIDAYFPLTDGDEPHTIDDIIKGWDSGEGYDFYYKNSSRQHKIQLKPEDAWKNIRHWWENEHKNPGGGTTPWVPKSKKIWFTEYGFPSVDQASNQPNVFWSTDSIEAGLPRHSCGALSHEAQRDAIYATHKRWQGSDMVERLFLWTWDARPFPHWPDRKDVWADGECWYRGHWVQGKLGFVDLANVVAELCLIGGLELDDIDVSDISGAVYGIVSDGTDTVMYMLKSLSMVYGFDIVVNNGKICFIKHKNIRKTLVKHINYADMVAGTYTVHEATATFAPTAFNIGFVDRYTGDNAIKYAGIGAWQNNNSMYVELPIVMDGQMAESLCYNRLYMVNALQKYYSFELPAHYVEQISPGDLLKILDSAEQVHEVKVISCGFDYSRILIECVSYYFINNLLCNLVPQFSFMQSVIDSNPAYVSVEYINCYLTNYEVTQGKLNKLRILVAVSGLGARNMRDYGLYIHAASEVSDEGNAMLELRSSNIVNTQIGVTNNLLHSVNSTCLVDWVNYIDVTVFQGKLFNRSDQFGNMAMVGNEVIIFERVESIGVGRYKLWGLFRGLLGTDKFMSTHNANERFVLLDSNVMSVDMPSVNCIVKCGILKRKPGHELPKYVRTSDILISNSAKLKSIGIFPIKPVFLRCLFGIESYDFVWVARACEAAYGNNSIKFNPLFHVQCYVDGALLEEGFISVSLYTISKRKVASVGRIMIRVAASSDDVLSDYAELSVYFNSS